MRKGFRKLLFSVTADDCIWKEKRGSGNGGQKRNKTNSAIQCFHEPSGAMGEAEDSRKQSENRKNAFLRMIETNEFKVWHKLKIDAYMGLVEIEEPNEQGFMVKRKLRGDEV